ncbi:MAG: hypothetical protein OHK0013_27540 [Sandaracinaceae bacterium]
MPYFLRWALAFAFTEVVEAPIYAFSLDPIRPRRERWAIALAASLLTHPLVWFVFPELTRTIAPEASPWLAIALAESFAVLTEAAWLAAFGSRLALAIALLANGTSFTLGLFLYTYLGW